jgi:hemoglobin-like flavoprotein
VTPQQIELVQSSFRKVLPIRDQAGVLFYRHLFEIAPEVRPMFAEDVSGQAQKLMAMIAAAVAGLDDLDSLVPKVQELGRGHLAYGVKEEHYEPVGEALLQTLDQGLGDDFTPEVADAWTACYGLLAETMIDAARQVAA